MTADMLSRLLALLLCAARRAGEATVLAFLRNPSAVPPAAKLAKLDAMMDFFIWLVAQMSLNAVFFVVFS